MKPVNYLTAVNQDQRPSFVSDNYGFIQTRPIVNMLADNGWHLVSTKESKARKPEKIGFTKHRLIFENESLKTAEESPRIYLLNSHDRSSAFSFNVGFLRFVCENGLMVGDAIGQQFKVFHTGRNLEENIYTKLVASIKAVPKAIDLMHELKQFNLSTEQTRELIHKLNIKVLSLRKLDPVLTESFYQVRRPEDKQLNAWTVFNVIQENAIKGGIKSTAALTSELSSNEVRRLQKARPITSLELDAKINKTLMDETINFIRQAS